eukprot:1107340-Rhodomonas_salina.2
MASPPILPTGVTIRLRINATCQPRSVRELQRMRKGHTKATKTSADAGGRCRLAERDCKPGRAAHEEGQDAQAEEGFAVLQREQATVSN